MLASHSGATVGRQGKSLRLLGIIAVLHPDIRVQVTKTQICSLQPAKEVQLH